MFAHLWPSCCLSFAPNVLTMHEWQRIFREAIKSPKELSQILGIDASDVHETYPIFIPRPLAEKIKTLGPNSSLWKQFVPSLEEISDTSKPGLYDPIADQLHAKGNGIIHRYGNRILFHPTTVCPVHCRYCFRKNELAQNDEILKGQIEALRTYLIEHDQVQEVILSGGDPLIVSEKKLFAIADAIKGRASFLRLHTRTPVILPQRVNEALLEFFHQACSLFDQVNVVIHTNHVQELDADVFIALKKMRETGVQLLSQSVLLKGINDDVKQLSNLFQLLIKHKVRPYYLHHPDKAQGAMHFHMPLEDGRKLYGQLREYLPGWAIPHYIIDSELGSGKNLAYNSESLHYSGKILDRFNRTHSLKL